MSIFSAAQVSQLFDARGKFALLMLHETINAKLLNLYEACKILYLAISKMEDDRMLVKPTYQKWINRVQKMKVELCARKDPNASQNAMPTTKIVKSLKNFSNLPDHIENRLMELKDAIESY